MENARTIHSRRGIIIFFFFFASAKILKGTSFVPLLPIRSVVVAGFLIARVSSSRAPAVRLFVFPVVVSHEHSRKWWIVVPPH